MLMHLMMPDDDDNDEDDDDDYLDGDGDDVENDEVKLKILYEPAARPNQ